MFSSFPWYWPFSSLEWFVVRVSGTTDNEAYLSYESVAASYLTISHGSRICWNVGIIIARQTLGPQKFEQNN